MATRQADDFDAIAKAMKTPWQPKRVGTKLDHCDHCPKALDEECVEPCMFLWEKQHGKSGN